MLPDLSRDAIFAADDLRHTPVEVPEWGGTVYVRCVKLRERLEAAALLQTDEDVTVKILILMTCDARGRKLFTPGDAAALAERNGAACQRIVVEALRLNKIGEPETAEAEKKSGPTTTSDSPTG